MGNGVGSMEPDVDEEQPVVDTENPGVAVEPPGPVLEEATVDHAIEIQGAPVLNDHTMHHVDSQLTTDSIPKETTTVAAAIATLRPGGVPRVLPIPVRMAQEEDNQSRRVSTGNPPPSQDPPPSESGPSEEVAGGKDRLYQENEHLSPSAATTADPVATATRSATKRVSIPLQDWERFHNERQERWMGFLQLQQAQSEEFFRLEALAMQEFLQASPGARVPAVTPKDDVAKSSAAEPRAMAVPIGNPYLAAQAAASQFASPGPVQPSGWQSTTKLRASLPPHSTNKMTPQQQQLKTPQPGLSQDTADESTDSPGYAYQEVVRKKAERQALPQYECVDCAAFGRAVGMPIRYCRHRFRFPPPETPPGFWDLDFADEKSQNKTKPTK